MEAKLIKIEKVKLINKYFFNEDYEYDADLKIGKGAFTYAILKNGNVYLSREIDKLARTATIIDLEIYRELGTELLVIVGETESGMHFKNGGPIREASYLN